jgi:peptide/nickel transport system substrate-binding protein
MTDRPVSRRAVLGSLGAGAFALYAAGCGGTSARLPPAGGGAGAIVANADVPPGTADPRLVPGPQATGGRRGGKVINAWDSEGNGYDPIIAYTSTGWDAICNLLYAPLYSYAADGTPAPNAAEAMPDVSADGLVYTIPLRPGVYFHHGREVTAADYKYSWERLLDPKLESWASSYVYSIKGASRLYDRKAKTLAGVKALDRRTLQVTLEAPDVTFLYALTQPFTAPVPKEVVARYGKDFWYHVVGNGPFTMAEYDSQGQRTLFKRFEGYFWEGLPYLDEVEFRWGYDPSVELLMLQRGEVDILGTGFASDSLAEIGASPHLQPFRFEQSLLACRWVELHPRAPAFRNKLVREALNWATDREQLQRVTFGEADAWGAPFPKAQLAGTRTFTPYHYDPERARALLRKAGDTGRRPTLWVSIAPEPELGQVLQQQWRSAGFDVKLRQGSYDTVSELSYKGKCDAWIATYYAIYPTALDLISQYWETGGSANYTKYSNSEVDRLTRKARATTDTGERNALLAQVETVLGEDAAGVFLENVNWIMGRNPGRLHNFHYSGVYGSYYDRLWV